MKTSALDLNSGSSHYATGAVTGLTTDTVGTMMGWCRPETLHNGTVFWLGNSALGLEYVRLGVISDGTVRAYHTEGFYKKTDAFTYAAGQLLHLALTQDGVGPQIYVNGVAESMADQQAETDATAWINDIAGPADVVALGRNNDSSPDYYFNGIIGPWAYCNAALTATEILEHFNRRPANEIQPDHLERNFGMTEGSGTTVRDWARGYDLTTVNAPPWVDGLGSHVLPAFTGGFHR